MPVQHRIETIDLGAGAPSLDASDQASRLLSGLKDGNQALDCLRRALERDEAIIQHADEDRPFSLV